MKAIEFVTDARDGMIKIPAKYVKECEKKLRVIILVDEAVAGVVEKKVKKGQPLSAMSVKTKGLAFDRDEANE